MPPFEARPDFLKLWGIARGAVEIPELAGNRNRVAQYIHASYRESYIAQGQEPPPLSIFDVNPMVSLAYQQRAAKATLGRSLERLEREGVSEALTPAMRAPDIDAQAGAGYIRPEKLRIRIGFTTTEETLPTQWVTRELDLGEVSSVGEIRDIAEEYAASRAADYGLDFDGLDGVEITFT